MRCWALMVMLLMAMGLLLGGCGRGMALSASERRHRIDKVMEVDSRQLVDDWDMFWLNDYPSRMSTWSTE